MNAAICYARVLGPRKARTPEQHPILIASAPFDDSVTTPAKAIADAAARTLGIMPNLASWSILAQYEFTPEAKARYEQNVKYQRVYVFEYLAERAMRKHLNIDDACLDPMAGSWYLTRV